MQVSSSSLESRIRAGYDKKSVDTTEWPQINPGYGLAGGIANANLGFQGQQAVYTSASTFAGGKR